jgi:hypothetical protein
LNLFSEDLNALYQQFVGSENWPLGMYAADLAMQQVSNIHGQNGSGNYVSNQGNQVCFGGHGGEFFLLFD